MRSDRHETQKRKEFLRVLRFTVNENLIMNVRPGRASGAAEEPDLGMRRNALADRNGLPVQMGITAGQAVPVVYLDHLAIIVPVARISNYVPAAVA